MEFQFGTNWAGFSRYAGSEIGQTVALRWFLIGLPLALRISSSCSGSIAARWAWPGTEKGTNCCVMASPSRASWSQRRS